MDRVLTETDLLVILPLVVIQIILAIIATFDWIKQGENVRGNRWVWLVVIVIINTIGPISYFLFGRKRDE